MNPAKSWNNLSRNGKIAVVAGVLAIALLWYYHDKQKQAATAAAAAATSDASGTSDTSSDTGSTDTGYNGYSDSSLDPSSAYTTGYEDALSAYGSDLYQGGYGYGGYTGTDTSSGAGATNSTAPTTTPTAPPVNVTVNTPSSSTGGGAPNAPAAAEAHTVSTISTGKLLSSGAILAPTGNRTTKSGYVTVGTGGGNYQYVPVSLAPKGYTIYHSVSSSKPQANAKGLGNGLWAVPV